MYVLEPSTPRPATGPAAPVGGLGGPDDGDRLKEIRTQLPSCSPAFETLPDRPCTGSLGKTHGGRQVHFYFFPGTDEERALVIGGVHGSELAGIEVAQRLVERLHADAARGARPDCHVVVVPELFRDNAARARAKPRRPGADNNRGRCTVDGRCPKRKCGKAARAKCVDPNRQFPAPGQAFDPGNPVDALGTRIEAENRMLLTLIAGYRPGRIASVHAKRMPSRAQPTAGAAAPGIFADPHAIPAGNDPQAVRAAAARSRRDATLALDMAAKVRDVYDQRTRTTDGAGRVAGNRLGTKKPTALYGKASHQCGTSLGGWGPHPVFRLILLPPFGTPVRLPLRDSLTVITVEVRHYYPSSEKRSPVKRETRRGVKHRVVELEAYSTALRRVFLRCAGRPAWPEERPEPAPRPTPTPGHLYQIRRGDTLLSIAGRAFGVGPGGRRLAYAKLINDAAYNRRFWRPAPQRERKWFPRGQISFLPRFAPPDQQARRRQSAPPGRHFARILIPRPRERRVA